MVNQRWQFFAHELAQVANENRGLRALAPMLSKRKTQTQPGTEPGFKI